MNINEPTHPQPHKSQIVAEFVCQSKRNLKLSSAY